MARILAYTSPARGHLFPLTPILLELCRRGHSIALRTLESEVPRLGELGFDARPIDPKIENLVHDDWQAGNARAALARNPRYDVAHLTLAVALRRLGRNAFEDHLRVYR